MNSSLLTVSGGNSLILPSVALNTLNLCGCVLNSMKWVQTYKATRASFTSAGEAVGLRLRYLAETPA